MITRLALGALPQNPVKETLTANLGKLEYYSVEPDKLREIYGKTEGRRHYIDLEYYGAEPFAALNPSFSEMVSRYGIRRVDKAGTLPWAIEQVASRLKDAWRAGNCRRVIRLSGHLSHYIADASQPLHTTIHFEGYPGDGHLHERLEKTADYNVARIEPLARGQVHPAPIGPPWPAIMDELRESHALVSTVIQDDRSVRAMAPRSKYQFDRLLYQRDHDWIIRQTADAASVLASIWTYEWEQAGGPAVCGASGQ
ncbi:MAG: zinc dependent phospholipase C family protein [Candidatus Binataceae bacterium]